MGGPPKVLALNPRALRVWGFRGLGLIVRALNPSALRVWGLGFSAHSEGH